jgi:hypothetical protein
MTNTHNLIVQPVRTLRKVENPSETLHKSNDGYEKQETTDNFLYSDEISTQESSVVEEPPRTSIDNQSSSVSINRLPETKKNRATVIIYAPQRQTILSPSPLFPSNSPIPTEQAEIGENISLMYSERETEALKEIFTFLVTKQPK